jgi:hypothetical protein
MTEFVDHVVEHLSNKSKAQNSVPISTIIEMFSIVQEGETQNLLRRKKIIVYCTRCSKVGIYGSMYYFTESFH